MTHDPTRSFPLQLGADYLAYRRHPNQCHSEFCVRVVLPRVPPVAIEITAGTRTAHGAHKRLLLCTAHPRRDASGGKSDAQRLADDDFDLECR